MVLTLLPYDRQKSMFMYMPVMKPLQPPAYCGPLYVVQRLAHSWWLLAIVIRPSPRLYRMP